MTQWHLMPPAKQAAILCGQDTFQRFAAEQSNALPGQTFNTSAAAEYLRLFCGVNSRADLNKNHTAAARLAVLQTEYDAWRGKIPSQR